MELIIPLIGAIVAIIVSIIGAYLANRNSIVLQTRKLKESHYINFISSLHNLCAYNDNKEIIAKYVETRDVLFSVASSEVIANIIIYETNTLGCESSEIHDKHLTSLIKSIRKDLKLNNKGLPTLFFKKA